MQLGSSEQWTEFKLTPLGQYSAPSSYMRGKRKRASALSVWFSAGFFCPCFSCLLLFISSSLEQSSRPNIWQFWSLKISRLTNFMYSRCTFGFLKWGKGQSGPSPFTRGTKKGATVGRENKKSQNGAPSTYTALNKTRTRIRSSACILVPTHRVLCTQ